MIANILGRSSKFSSCTGKRIVGSALHLACPPAEHRYWVLCEPYPCGDFCIASLFWSHGQREPLVCANGDYGNSTLNAMAKYLNELAKRTHARNQHFIWSDYMCVIFTVSVFRAAASSSLALCVPILHSERSGPFASYCAFSSGGSICCPSFHRQAGAHHSLASSCTVVEPAPAHVTIQSSNEASRGKTVAHLPATEQGRRL